MTKYEILTEIYKEQSRINALQGKPEIDLSQPGMKGRIEEEADASYKADLISRLERTRRSYEETRFRMQYQARVDAYYATPEGAQFKAQTEAAIEQKIAEWETCHAEKTDVLGRSVKQFIGEQWGVCRFEKGYLEIGVIDAGKSTEDRREYYFGQSIEIRYQADYLGTGEQRFEVSCGSCGSFAAEGGHTVGERAMFYVGVGLFLASSEFLSALKVCLHNTAERFEQLAEEMTALRKQLKAPIPADDQTE